MVKFERNRERKGRSDSRDSSPRRDFRKKRGFDDDRSERSFGRSRFGRDRRDVEMTRVTCSSCGSRCEVPFKPTSSKPVYCSDCFSKNDKSSSGKSSRDLDMINEKLDKIMRALDIE